MAIVNDTIVTINGAFSTGATIATGNATGSNRLAVVCLSVETPIVYTDVTGITYGGVAMTRAIGITVSSPTYAYGTSDIWYLWGPATGSQSVVITRGAGSTQFRGSLSTWTGVSPFSTLDATASSEGVNNQSQAITTTVDNALIVDCFSSSANNPTENGAQTLLKSYTGSSPRHGSSYRIVTTAGGYTMQWTDDGASDNTMAVVAFKPFIATDYPLSVTVGAFVLTGIGLAVSFGRLVTATVGAHTLTFNDIILSWYRKWIYGTKHDSTLDMLSKSAMDVAAQNHVFMDDNNVVFMDDNNMLFSAGTDGWSNVSKNSASFTNQSKS